MAQYSITMVVGTWVAIGGVNVALKNHTKLTPHLLLICICYKSSIVYLGAEVVQL